ncbi:MAG: Competence protein A [Candidatus Omnitrophica bacterium ADurb.Bin205]|nr:MAG: Competence protein A [Candidatus Omnitrophica bacterium ADurb.Bin205]
MKNILSKIKDGLSKDRISTGVDIGSAQIKAVKIKSSKDQIELVGFDIEPSKFDLGEVLRKVLDPHSGLPVNISVSGQQSVIRYVNFPRMSDSELKQALKFEAQKHIPFSVSEVNLDGYILKDNLPDNKMLVLVAAVKKELVNQRLKLVEGVGYRVDVVDIDSIALVNLFNFNNPFVASEEKKAVALLNIGASTANLNILDEGIPRLSRDMHIAGNAFTQKIADILSIEFAEAEKLKINPDPDKLNKIKAGAESALANLAGEIRTSFDYYESQGTSTVGKIFLSGGSAKFTGLKDMLEHFLNIEVEEWDPLRQLKIGSNIDLPKLKAVQGELVVALGLALHNS